MRLIPYGIFLLLSIWSGRGFTLNAAETEEAVASKPVVRLATFDLDVTPPLGSMMAYDRVKRLDELGLRARGIILLGSGKPIVLCAVDWIGIANESHDAFRDRLAKGAGTTRDRVALHTLHQHDAPRCDFTAESLLHHAGASDLGSLEGSFAREVLGRLEAAVRDAVPSTVTVTHAGFGSAKVKQVASNRRILGDDGKVAMTRYTACRDPKIRAQPEGVIDPQLNCLSFWNGDQAVAILTYYACHPQSYYRTGVPSPDFPGIARFLRGQDQPDALHVHFNGAGGNLGAGKYNDGRKENRMILANRVADGMKRAFEATEKFPLTSTNLGWAVTPVALPPGEHLDAEALRKQISATDAKEYWSAPVDLAWLLRCQSGHKIELSCLKVGDIRVIHMPGELFVEYQLAAKKMRPDLKVAMAAYGDYGPGYIGTKVAYGEGGYETSPRASKVDESCEEVLIGGIKTLLGKKLGAEEGFASELPRIPPTEAVDTLPGFSVAKGFQIQLVASEPLMGSPVAMEWDAQGGLFVCEMRGYSEDREEGLSRISRLIDTDGDGVYDQSTVYAEGLFWPTAIFPFDGGLFVGDAPDLHYFKDIDEDGKAELKKTVFTGFGTSNVQGLLNSFRWGLDHRIHVACSSSGGMVRRPDDPESMAKNVRGRDLAFNPRTLEFELTSGGAQHGMCFDDWGRKFMSSNSDHIQQVMYEDRYIARNRWMTPPGARLSIAADGPQAEVFRTSPVEPWRIVRTRLRVSGAVPGIIEGGGRSAGYFTGATGVTLYRGDAWPNQWRGTAVVGDVGGNLIHRKKLSQHGVALVANRIDQGFEFVSSSDIWFRPAQFANAPDGSLHVIDVCREVIEHPKALPPEIKQHLDLTAGRDRGRIYRIVQDGFQHRKTPSLADATTDELVALLEHPNAWHRETASRLLYEQQDSSAVEPLREILEKSSSPRGRLHAMYALDGLSAWDHETLMVGLADDHPQVRRHAIRLSEKLPASKAVADGVADLVDDDSIDVRYQLAFTIGAMETSRRSSVLAKLIHRDEDQIWMQTAVQSSLGKGAGDLFVKLVSDPGFRSDSSAAFLRKLASQIGQQDIETDLEQAMAVLPKLPVADAPFSLPIIGELFKHRNRPGSVLSRFASAGRLHDADAVVADMVLTSIDVATDESKEISKREAAISALSFGKFDRVFKTLSNLIDNREPHQIQSAAITTLGKFTSPKVAAPLLAAWPSLSPQLRTAASEVLFARNERILAMFDAVDTEEILSADLPRTRIVMAAESKDKTIQRRAKAMLDASGANQRQEVVNDYRESLQLPGDFDRGRVLFKEHCSVCHKVEGIGFEIGPNLATIKTRGAETIMVNVLDPNREVNPQFVNYIVLTEDGRAMTGMIASESASSITLRRAENATDTVLRVDMDEMQSTGQSIMPEGLEKVISQQAMADIIDYLMKVK